MRTLTTATGRSRTRRAPRLVVPLVLALSALPGAAEAGGPVTEWHVPVLMYHRIAPDSDLRRSNRDLVVRPRLFARHMRTLKEHGWTTITAEALAVAMRDGVTVPRRTVVLTFDDGTQDVFTHAWPIMQRHGYVGSFYLITSKTHRQNRSTSYSMSQPQALVLEAGGNEIGNHTRDHACLSGRSHATAFRQVDGGARDIRHFTGDRPMTLAWPFGCHDATSIRAARDARTFLAFTTRTGCRETLGTRLVSPRLRVSRSTTPERLLQMVSSC